MKTRCMSILIFMSFIFLKIWGAVDLVDYVNPQIDTHKSRWFFFSSASRPFGMVSLSPDNVVKGSWNSGYLYDSTYVRCFSHIHCWQLSGIPVMPTVGNINGQNGMDCYKSKYSHNGEIVKPGYHKIKLDKYNIEVELTSTNRVGFHRYNYFMSDTANVLFDVGAYLAHGETTEAKIYQSSDDEISGFSLMAPTHRRKKSIKVYFVAKFNFPISSFGGWEKDESGKKCLSNKRIYEGKDIGGFVRFYNLGNNPLLMKVAVSYVSEEQARLNMQEELPHWSFDDVVKDSFDEWNRELSKIKVEGGSYEQKVKFYTDLWHSLLGRHTFSDVNGKYIDNTGKEPVIRCVPLDNNGKPTRNTYNSDAFWGAEFNLNILWSIAYPKRMSEFVSTLVDYYNNGGLIARGPSGGNYTYVMVGDQATPLISAAYNKGIRDFDIKMAYEGCLKNSEPGGIRDHAGYEVEPNKYMSYYINYGFVPDDIKGKGGHVEGCAMTLYFAYQDWCMAQFAKSLGKDDVYDKYFKRSFSYRNVFDKTVGWMRPKMSDGSWMKDFMPIGKGFNMKGFVESNSAIFTYYVPHNMLDLVNMIGGKEKFINRLSEQFEKASHSNFITPHGSHAENWVDYENQPSLHMAHLFSYAGAPWLTQYWVRRIKKEVFGDITPYGGYNGDEDQGQIGALGVLMAIGLFDVQGGASVEPYYEITSPIFDKVEISLDQRYYEGRKIVIDIINNSEDNVYIQKVFWNGKPYNSFRISHKELMKGGTLTIELGKLPNKDWGIY